DISNLPKFDCFYNRKLRFISTKKAKSGVTFLRLFYTVLPVATNGLNSIYFAIFGIHKGGHIVNHTRFFMPLKGVTQGFLKQILTPGSYFAFHKQGDSGAQPFVWHTRYEEIIIHV